MCVNMWFLGGSGRFEVLSSMNQYSTVLVFGPKCFLCWQETISWVSKWFRIWNDEVFVLLWVVLYSFWVVWGWFGGVLGWFGAVWGGLGSFNGPWSPYTNQGIKKVEMVQRRAIKWTLNNFLYYASVTDMHNQLCWRTLEQRRADARLIMLYKIINGIAAIPLPSYFQEPQRMTRHSHPLSLTQIHSSADYYKYSFFPLSVVQYNRLPANVVVLPTLELFGMAVRSMP